MIDVTAIGELLIDFTCQSKDEDGFPSLDAHPGGAPTNFLATLAKYGAKTAFLSKVGRDAFGEILINFLANKGIETRGIVSAEEAFTTLAFVTLNSKGDREFSFARKPGADTCISFDELDLSLIDDAKVFHFGTLSLTDEPARSTTYKAVEYAKSKRKIITFDPNLRKPLWKDIKDASAQMIWGLKQADIVKISDNEVDFLFGIDSKNGAEYIFENFNASLVFVTCGENGCFFKNSNGTGFVPSLKNLKVTDTTGAGDIFGGAALWKILQYDKRPFDLSEEELYDITCFASAAAGLSTVSLGGASSVPEFIDVLNACQDLKMC